MTIWKVPAIGAYRLAIEPRFPDSCRSIGDPTTMHTDRAFLERSRIRCDPGLGGKRIAIRGLEATLTDVLVRVEAVDGTVQTARLTPAAPDFIVPTAPGRLAGARAYLGLGVEHILFGLDHPLFVLGLLLIVPDRWVLLKAISAFTLAHSITLGAATLGYVHLPTAQVNALIALSILFLRAEVMRQRKGGTSLAVRHPWIMAFAFGLLHGLGFASGLIALGLSKQEVPLAWRWASSWCWGWSWRFGVRSACWRSVGLARSRCCQLMPSGRLARSGRSIGSSR